MSTNLGYINKGKEILTVLNTNGYQAYFVGGVVRSIILDIPFSEIDIITSANLEQIKKCLKNHETTVIDESKLALFYKAEVFFISTFRKASEKDKKKIKRIHYSESLQEDLISRDFTINAIAMNNGSMLTDALNGYRDLNRKVLRAIGNPRQRFKEDPVKILRAIRLIGELGFRPDFKTANALSSRAKYLKDLELNYSVLREIKKIFEGEHLKLAIKHIEKAKIYKYIPFFQKPIKRLINRYIDIDFETLAIASFVANKQIPKVFENFFDNIKEVEQLTNLVVATKKAEFPDLVLYTYGLDACLKVNNANLLLSKRYMRPRKLKAKYDKLPIKGTCDLAFKGEDILVLTNNVSGSFLPMIVEEMAHKVINKELDNDREELKTYAIARLNEILGHKKEYNVFKSIYKE